MKIREYMSWVSVNFQLCFLIFFFLDIYSLHIKFEYKKIYNKIYEN